MDYTANEPAFGEIMKTILQYLEKNALKFPDKTLFSDIENSISYPEFIDKCKKTASGLKPALNGKRNMPIAVFDNRNIGTLTGMFSVLYSGNYYVVLDSNSPAERLQKILDVIKPVIILYSSGNETLLKTLSHTAKAFDLAELEKNEADEDFIKTVRDNMISADPMYALFTSGSTGTPKGTVLSHANVINYVSWFTECFDINENTVFGNQTPFYFSMSVSDIFGTVMAGATFNIIPKLYFSFPIRLVKFMNDRKINAIYWVPSALSIVANIKLFDYEKPLYLTKVMFAGEVMPNKQLNYWRKSLNNVMFANLFGPTETTDICTYYIVDRPFSDDESLPIGRRCDNCDTFIVDESNNEITAPGVVGELYVRGSFVAYGYYDNPEKTSSAFVQNPLNPHYPETVYKTGDLVKLNEFGEYVYAGRKDFQIKHMGYRIELGEIETAAGALEKVNSAVCVYDGAKDLIVMIYEGKLKPDDLLTGIKAKVPYYMVPNTVIKVAGMPINANGKIDRNYLKNNYESLIKKD